jgi:hypothetical protein
MATIQNIENGDSGLIARNKINDNANNLNSDKLEVSLKGAANGLAELDSGGKVPISQIPNSIQGGIKVIGTWNANTNTPDLSALTLSQGEAYQVSVAGSTNLNGETNWKAKDLAIWDDALAGNYFKLDNTDDVISVAGKTGVVTLAKADVGLANVDNTSDANKPVSTAQQTALDGKVDLSVDGYNALVNTDIPIGTPDGNKTNLRFGTNSLESRTLATDSTAIGNECAPLLEEGTRNSLLGKGVAPNATTLVDASIVGADTAQGLVTGNRISILGSGVFPPSTLSDAIILSTGGIGADKIKAEYSSGEWEFATGTAQGAVLASDGSGSGVFTVPSSPTIQKFTSGTGTYTTPANVKYIRVRMVGGGAGGGGASATGGPVGSNGGDTTFDDITAGGGQANTNYRAGGLGGVPSLGSRIGYAYNGGEGSFARLLNSSQYYSGGGQGGDTPFIGGGGKSGQWGANGQSGQANTGGGGQGAGVANNSGMRTGAGGGSGAYVEAIIPNPLASYSYSIGLGGVGGVGSRTGGAGGSGYIEVTEYYI